MRLRLVDLNIEAEFLADGVLPSFRGTTLRGAFGFALKSTVCHISHRDCQRCILRSRCAYPVVFEGVAPDDRVVMRKYPYIPQPFVLLVSHESPTSVRAGDRFRFGLRLFGPACDLFPYAVFAVIRLGDVGIGRDRIPFKVSQVTDAGALIYRHGDDGIFPPATREVVIHGAERAATRLTLRFETPARLKADGQFATTITPEILFRSLWRRLRILGHFYGTEEPAIDLGVVFAELEAARLVESSLRWHEVSRFSGRQQERMQLGGIVGHVVMDLPKGRASEILRLAQEVHVGKATSFGFGRVTCEDLPQ